MRNPLIEQGAGRRTPSLISQIALPELAPCALLRAGCRASQGRFPPPLLIRQFSSVVDSEYRELLWTCQEAPVQS